MASAGSNVRRRRGGSSRYCMPSGAGRGRSPGGLASALVVSVDADLRSKFSAHPLHARQVEARPGFLPCGGPRDLAEGLEKLKLELQRSPIFEVSWWDGRIGAADYDVITDQLQVLIETEVGNVG